MELLLSNKVAIVTSASRGIGRAIAKTLSAEGVKVSLVARSRAELESLVQSTDLRDPAAATQVVDASIETFGRLDALVNNAGATKRGDFLTLTDEEWADGFALKFYGAMRRARAAWTHLQASQGTIINIIGVGGRMRSAEFTIGGAVSAALWYFSPRPRLLTSRVHSSTWMAAQHGLCDSGNGNIIQYTLI